MSAAVNQAERAGSPTFNPLSFSTEVIDQFGRYLLTTFPIADPSLEEQVRARVRHALGGERLIAKGPYVFLNRPFEPGPSLQALAADDTLRLHRALPAIFPFEALHRHQELALRSACAGRHTIVATGTGSGKTEAFLLPILDHALKLRDASAEPGVIALVIYPMNALADDQLRRLRPLLAGTGITYGRYTGVTPDSGEPASRLEHSRAYTRKERELLDEGEEERVPLPWEECWSRDEIRTRRPRILLTNYSQLEYLLLRDKDLDLFRRAPLRFLVLDEVHTYTGALGSEVACLVRRLRRVARKGPQDIVCFGTSATVQEGDQQGHQEADSRLDSRIDARKLATDFAARLFGVPAESVELVTERYRSLPARGADHYRPPAPKDPAALLEHLLEAASPLHTREEVADLPPEVLAIVEALCGRAAPDGPTPMRRAHALLASNGLVQTLHQMFSWPALIESAFPRLRALGRDRAGDEDLTAEILAYLVLGALVQEDGEPLLRPRLHYFVQGYQGLALCYGHDRAPQIKFAAAGGHAEDGALIVPMVLCRSCGQHYLALVVTETHPTGERGGVVLETAVDPTGALDTGSHADHRGDADNGAGAGGDDNDDAERIYLTERLVGPDEDTEDEITRAALCRFCGAINPEGSTRCHAPRCGRTDGLVPVFVHRGPLKSCLACGTAAKGYEEIVTPARSSEVADVTILAQSMLSAMEDPRLRKLLVFTDNRQEAAFQAGWMEERSLRFRLRHLLYTVLDRDRERVWPLDELTDEMLDESHRQGIYRPGAWSDRDNQVRLRWFLLEEFMSTGQRRGSLESLALAEVRTARLGPDDAPDFYARWAPALGLGDDDLARLLRLLADAYRRRGVVSDELLSRQWSYQDHEVRKRLIRTHDRYRPLAVLRETRRRSSYTRGWLARNGRSLAQAIISQTLVSQTVTQNITTTVDRDTREAFLEAVWEWWRADGILVPVTLTRKYAGKASPIDVGGQAYQLNVDLLGIAWSDHHVQCAACRRGHAVLSPNGRCPEYGCAGTLAPADRPADHFDVVQYTRGRFVPLRVREHSAQVPKEERQEIEREFKKEGLFRCSCG